MTEAADDGGSRRARPDRRTWIQSDRRIPRRIARPLREFLDIEAAGGVVLLAATVASLILANSPAGDSIASFWEEELTLLEFGDFQLTETLGHWVNDGLMAIFFFVVGLEIKRELVTGDLRDPRRAALPAIAAVGGMVLPAALFLVFNLGGNGSRGWGIPMATDIAFAVGVMALLGDRVPSPLKVFLLTLAIVDDIGAIAVIAIFYSEGLSFRWLTIAAALLVIIVLMRAGKVWYVPAYVVVGTGVWVAMLKSGVHATIAGVLLGLLTPARPLRPAKTELTVRPSTSWSKLRRSMFDAKETIAVAERLQHLVHPWSSFLILPVFAFANAGIELSADGLADAAQLAAHARSDRRPRDRQATRHRGDVVRGSAQRRRYRSARHAVVPRRRGGSPRRHRFHGVELRDRAGLRQRSFPGRSEDRRARGVRGGGADRCHRPVADRPCR